MHIFIYYTHILPKWINHRHYFHNTDREGHVLYVERPTLQGGCIIRDLLQNSKKTNVKTSTSAITMDDVVMHQVFLAE